MQQKETIGRLDLIKMKNFCISKNTTTISTTMFIAAVVTVAKIWKQLKSPLMNE